MEINNQTELKYINEIRHRMDYDKLMLCYRGEMSQDIVMALLSLTESKLSQEKSDITTKARVFSVMVECLQNITQHSEKNRFSQSNLFMIGNKGDGYIIHSGNVIVRSKVMDLKDKLVRINTMNEEELKEFGKYLIKHDTISGETGFGLGLIQIARKTGNSIDFDFEEIGDEHFFFSLSTKIDQ